MQRPGIQAHFAEIKGRVVEAVAEGQERHARAFNVVAVPMAEARGVRCCNGYNRTVFARCCRAT